MSRSAYVSLFILFGHAEFGRDIHSCTISWNANKYQYRILEGCADSTQNLQTKKTLFQQGHRHWFEDAHTNISSSLVLVGNLTIKCIPISRKHWKIILRILKDREWEYNNTQVFKYIINDFETPFQRIEIKTVFSFDCFS